MNNKRITLLINSLCNGGAERVFVTIANELHASGWIVDVLLLFETNTGIQQEIHAGVPINVLSVKHARTSLPKLASYLIKKRPDRILAFNHQLVIILILIRILLGLKYKIISRNISILSVKRHLEKSIWHKYIVGNLTRMLYRKADYFIAQSFGMKTDMVKQYSISKDRIYVIHNPIGSRFSRADVTTQEAINDSYVLCIGRLEEVKAFNFAIDAFAVLSKEYNELRLKFVGDGSLRKSLEDQAKQLGVVDRIDFEGHKSDVSTYIMNAKFTLLTSIYEGFPNVLVESLKFGTPIVAFDCPTGPRDIVLNDLNGFLVRYKDVAHLIESCRKALSRTWDRTVIIDSAKGFSVDIIIKKYEDVLSK